MTGEYAGLWRYRVGNYRAIIDFDSTRVVIIALEVGHRSKVYR
ncbi:type II toxin-antitoxin system RelE family toxin [Rothia sp. P7181]